MIHKPVQFILVLLGLASLFLFSTQAAFATALAPATGVLTLNEAVALSLQRNRSLEQASLAVEVSSARRREVAGGFSPQLSLQESFGRQFADSTKVKAYDFSTQTWKKVMTDESWKNSFDTRVFFQMPLFTSGRLEANYRQADFNVAQVKANLDKTKQGLILDTITAYLTLLQSYNSVEIARQSVEQMQAHLKVATLNYDQGLVAKTDKLRSEVELAAAEQNLAKAENNVNLSRTTLCNLMGIDLTTQFTAKPIDQISYVLPPLSSLLDQAAKTRPELAAVSAQARAAGAGVTAAKAAYLPTVSLNASYDWRGETYAKNEENWTLLVVANLNVFDGGITAAKVTQAEKSASIVESQKRQFADQVTLEVTQALFNIEDAAKRLATAQKASSKADEDFRIARARYRGGISSNIEVLDSHVAFINAKNNLIQTQFDYYANYAKLLKSVGILSGAERMEAHE